LGGEHQETSGGDQSRPEGHHHDAATTLGSLRDRHLRDDDRERVRKQQ
jgi:anionic cell wall polymer biosynthesis LytR-Cps2A-Psr (LCP) family protein